MQTGPLYKRKELGIFIDALGQGLLILNRDTLLIEDFNDTAALFIPGLRSGVPVSNFLPVKVRDISDGMNDRMVENQLVEANSKWFGCKFVYPLFSDPGDILIIIEDTTEFVLNKLKLQNYYKRLAGLFNTPLVGIAFSSPDKGFMDANAKYLDLLGFDISDLLRTNWDEITHPDDLKSNYRLYNKLLKGEIDNYTIEKKYRRKDGRYIYVQMAVQAVRDHTGNLDYIIDLIQDISDRKEKELQLLEQNQKLEDFAFATSHNLRAPISNILGLTQLWNLRSVKIDNGMIIQFLQKSTEQLDDEIHKLIDIASAKKNN